MSNIREVERRSGQGSMEPILGKPLRYDEGFSKHGNNFRTYNNYGQSSKPPKDSKYWQPGEVAQGMLKYGVPATMRGQLGCGCKYAVLHGVGNINQDGTIETDYMCDFGYHNFIVFQLEQVERGQSRKVDKYGNITYGETYSAGSLEEY